MQAFSELRERLAEAYPDYTDWRRIAQDVGADPARIVFQGNAIGVWTNILNAIAVHRRVNGLRYRIEREHPELVELVDRYAAEALRGEGVNTDVPDLSFVEIDEADLSTKSAVESMSFSDTLHLALLEMAHRKIETAQDVMDFLLSGDNARRAILRLSEFTSKQEKTMTLLRNERSRLTSESASLRRTIETIEAARRPFEPQYFNALSVPVEQREYYRQTYESGVKAYRQALQRFENDRLSLPSLHSQLEMLRSRVLQLDLDISRQDAQGSDTANTLRDSVSRAIDQDLQRAISLTLDNVSDIMRRDAFRGFWTLLGAGCIVDFFLPMFSQPSEANAASMRFTSTATALMPYVESGIGTTGKGCLVPATLVLRNLVINRSSVAALKKRLDDLPLATLNEHCRHIQELIVEPPAVPQYLKIEHPAEIARVELALNASRTALDSLRAATRSELQQVDALRDITDSAMRGAKAVIERIRLRHEENEVLLQRTRLLWHMIEHPASGLPAFVSQLCTGISQEFQRRNPIAAMAIIEDATRTRLSLDEAQATLDAHVLAHLFKSRDALATHLQSPRKRQAFEGTRGRRA